MCLQMDVMLHQKVLASHFVCLKTCVTSWALDISRQRADDCMQWIAIFEGKGEVVLNLKPSEVLENLYAKEIYDEYIEPLIFPRNGEKVTIKNNDSVIFFNFRNDRARQLSKLIVDEREKMNLYFATLTEYDKSLNTHIAFLQTKIDTTISAEVSKVGFTQAHIAETEKYPHATYFLNGGREEPHDGEEHILVESRKDVLTHDLAPEMRAREIADVAIAQIMKGTNFIFLNFANADMVGHTANKPAIITAVETVDRELGRVVGALIAKGGVAIITADHGNAEVNIDPDTNERHTAHTLNVVPVILTEKGHILKNGVLSDIAPTVLSLFGISIPKSMTGKKLFD
jgi:2,3-bisphosphoglycerate-independent phosphoglycerate mutase